MKKLKKILQSNLTYIFLIVVIIIYIVITTIFIKYESKITSNTLEGVVTDLNINEDKISFILKNTENIKCNYYLKNENKSIYENLLGKKIRVGGSLTLPKNNTIPNTFNYKRYLYNNKIYKIFNVNNIEILEEENIFYKIKNKINEKFNQFDKITTTYLNLFIFGDKSMLDDTIYDSYRNNGIWHLFAVSGTHISLIILVLDKLLRKLKFKKTIIFVVLSYFIFLTNFAASVERACIFYFLKNILEYFHINLSNIKILFLTALIILLINPFMMYNVGFQYSFLISLAIMLQSKYIIGNYIIKILKISVISFFVSLPITVNMNYEINFLSVLLNIIYVPFITFIIFPVSILTVFLPFLRNVFLLCIKILEFSNIMFSKISLNITLSKNSVIIIIIYYLLLLYYHYKRKKMYIFISIVIIILNSFLLKCHDNYEVHYLDVNQGDSIVLISPYNNDVVMIDTGGLLFSNYNVSNNVILFMKSKGIRKIDKLILTHGDYDHMGEAINLVNNFKVEKVIFNNDGHNELETELIKVLKEKGIKYYKNMHELEVGNDTLYFLSSRLYDNENDNSSIIYTELNNYKFLFMGDAGVEVENDLIEKYNLQDIDVLKVGHHGSKTSSSKEFINEINPQYGVISVGKNNRYGHPSIEVLNTLENSKIYRTDQDGSIIFKIKHNKLKIETCTP